MRQITKINPAFINEAVYRYIDHSRNENLKQGKHKHRSQNQWRAAICRALHRLKAAYK